MVYSRLISRITLVSRVLMRILHESCMVATVTH